MDATSEHGTIKTLLVVGTPLIGFGFIGPFDDAAAAVQYAAMTFDTEVQWWVASLPTGEQHAKQEA